MKKLIYKILKERIKQKLFGKRLNVRQSWEDTPKEYRSMVEFLNWFDSTDSVQETIKRASSDWHFRFENSPYFSEIKKRSVLEIGFGGGRLLSQAAQVFDVVYGVDIHHNFDMTEKFLASQDICNATLLHRDGMGCVPNASVDLIYSFIVFQHFDGMGEVEFYLEHIHRLLTKDGVAHIYFGKNKDEGVRVIPESDFQLRDCSLFINPKNMLDRISEDFDVISYQDVLPRDPVLNTGESVQAMILFRNRT